MKKKKTIKKKSQLNFYDLIIINYIINNKRKINDKEKIRVKFLLSNNNYNYMINDEKEKNNKEKITIKFLLANNNYNYMIR